MTDQTPRKGFWDSLADRLSQWQTEHKSKREERERKSMESDDRMLQALGALVIMGGGLPEDIDKALGPENKVTLASVLLSPGSSEEKLAALKREQEQERKANKPPSPEEQYQREAEREMGHDFGRRAAYQAAGQRRIAEFLKTGAAGLTPEEVKREIENINDWVQRKIDEL